MKEHDKSSYFSKYILINKDGWKCNVYYNIISFHAVYA
jgi:hypothetical protein